jgi:AbrB family looped-hinge helix DNA binding protein
MEASSTVTSKGQITLPKAVRDALRLREGDRVVFRVDGDRAVLARTPDLLELAGSIRVPVAKKGLPWAQVVEEAHRAVGRRRR